MLRPSVEALDSFKLYAHNDVIMFEDSVADANTSRL